ncbi:alpha/beta hydrolase [Myroides sp. 1354]|uniref:alpha/beta fold hydrolase n=1 Tax=unclassified Myroides TaxID=2642485 RepID=UPI002578817B|nr:MULTISPECIES: alpha/beta hydrolase [unclassified Myroides]MDM1045211.1 alpha/beta hydrolase [Myroides sp. R163-1]MDM1056093.1 alpha/beta hydrolase [Myroides sp. 1354]MDM1069222.1 alpha/beta hydrolase [Myroides sp. 1372]
MNKIPIFFFPGMSSTSLIFERLEWDTSRFELHFLEWLPCEKKESLADYVQKYIPLIQQNNPILVGVSFGGIIAQEIAKRINVQKVIIISSVRSNKEFPKRFKWAKYTKVYKLIPTHGVEFLLRMIERYGNDKQKKRVAMYNRYLSIRDPHYLNWCIQAVLTWDQKEELNHVVHIHGTKDEVFPFKNIRNAIEVPGGTHAMIIVKYKWFNQHLEKIILK